MYNRNGNYASGFWIVIGYVILGAILAGEYVYAILKYME